MELVKKIFHFDKELNCIQTENGTLSLSSLFVPFFIEMILMNLMGTVNTVILGNYSDAAVAAVGTATQMLNMIYTFYTVVGTGASIIISQQLGANNHQRANDAANLSFILCGILSLVVGIALGIFARPVMSVMHLEDDVLVEAVDYFKICMLFSFLQAEVSVLSAILRAYGKARLAVMVAIFMNVLNALLNVIVVYRPFETPLHGVSGMAISCVISRLVALFVFILIVLRMPDTIRFYVPSKKSFSLIKSILYVGIPGGVSSVSYSLSQVVSTSIIAVFGTLAISAKVYLSNIFFYVYVVGLALGQATSIMIGHLIGAGDYDRADRLNKQNLKITIACNVTISLLIFIFGKYILRMFTSSTEIIEMSRIIMLIDIFVEIGRGFNHIEENSMRGAGDVMFQLVIGVLSCWGMSILFSYIFGVVCGLGLAGCWMAFAMDELFRGIIYFFRWRSGKWRQTKLV